MVWPGSLRVEVRAPCLTTLMTAARPGPGTVTISRLNRTGGLPSIVIEWDAERQTVSVRTWSRCRKAAAHAHRDQRDRPVADRPHVNLLPSARGRDRWLAQRSA